MVGARESPGDVRIHDTTSQHDRIIKYNEAKRREEYTEFNKRAGAEIAKIQSTADGFLERYNTFAGDREKLPDWTSLAHSTRPGATFYSDVLLRVAAPRGSA